MITKNQITNFARTLKTNESTVFREYLQLVFLNKLYKHKESNNIFFKGGTAIHLLFGAPRFSEDLDFTVTLPESRFLSCISDIFTDVSKEEEISFKERKTITGKRFLLTATPSVMPYATFINLDFSFREKVKQPQQSTIDTVYPVLFTSFIHHLSPEEICAEKIRAILTRRKGRDFFDLWYLVSKGVGINNVLVQEKLRYYDINDNQMHLFQKRIESFPEHDFINDMKPFLPIHERERLKEQFAYIKTYLLQKLFPLVKPPAE